MFRLRQYKRPWLMTYCIGPNGHRPYSLTHSFLFAVGLEVINKRILTSRTPWTRGASCRPNLLGYYYVLLPILLTIVMYYCIFQDMYGPSLINYCLVYRLLSCHTSINTDNTQSRPTILISIIPLVIILLVRFLFLITVYCRLLTLLWLISYQVTSSIKLLIDL